MLGISIGYREEGKEWFSAFGVNTPKAQGKVAVIYVTAVSGFNSRYSLAVLKERMVGSGFQLLPQMGQKLKERMAGSGFQLLLQI